jgi:anti-sigma regulatory factor (Ser/Thr protein kinase)
LKDLAFELSVPADPAFRPIAAEAAGKYGESLGLPEQEAGALTASAREAVDLAAQTAGASGGRGVVSLGVRRVGDALELTVSGGGTPATLSRSLTGAKR